MDIMNLMTPVKFSEAAGGAPTGGAQGGGQGGASGGASGGGKINYDAFNNATANLANAEGNARKTISNINKNFGMKLRLPPKSMDVKTRRNIAIAVGVAALVLGGGGLSIAKIIQLKKKVDALTGASGASSGDAFGGDDSPQTSVGGGASSEGSNDLGNISSNDPNQKWGLAGTTPMTPEEIAKYNATHPVTKGASNQGDGLRDSPQEPIGQGASAGDASGSASGGASAGGSGGASAQNVSVDIQPDLAGGRYSHRALANAQVGQTIIRNGQPYQLKQGDIDYSKKALNGGITGAAERTTSYITQKDGNSNPPTTLANEDSSEVQEPLDTGALADSNASSQNGQEGTPENNNASQNGQEGTPENNNASQNGQEGTPEAAPQKQNTKKGEKKKSKKENPPKPISGPDKLLYKSRAINNLGNALKNKLNAAKKEDDYTPDKADAIRAEHTVRVEKARKKIDDYYTQIKNDPNFSYTPEVDENGFTFDNPFDKIAKEAYLAPLTPEDEKAVRAWINNYKNERLRNTSGAPTSGRRF